MAVCTWATATDGGLRLAKHGGPPDGQAACFAVVGTSGFSNRSVADDLMTTGAGSRRLRR